LSPSSKFKKFIISLIGGNNTNTFSKKHIKLGLNALIFVKYGKCLFRLDHFETSGVLFSFNLHNTL